jgi:prevent-host-death family protein
MQVNLHDAKTHLSRYVDQALAGEEVVIARAGKPLVKLVPLESQVAPRRGGFLRPGRHHRRSQGRLRGGDRGDVLWRLSLTGFWWTPTCCSGGL